MSGPNSFNGPPEKIPPKDERKQSLLLKLREELKVFNASVLVIDATKYVEGNKVPEYTDIFVTAKGDLKDIRDYLGGEEGIEVHEGLSPLFSKKDTAFYIKITN